MDFQLAQISLELLEIIYLYLSDSGSVWTIIKVILKISWQFTVNCMGKHGLFNKSKIALNC